VKKPVLLGILFTLAVLATLIYTTLGNAKFRCEVCITYKGEKMCRIAAASTKEQALRAATDNACADISHSMTDAVNCPNTPPDSVKWLSGR
jgi:hypothetical protein